MLGIVGYGMAAAISTPSSRLCTANLEQVTLADLYISFWLMSMVMFVFSPRKWTAVPWIVAINVIGSPVSGLWLLLNLPRLRKAMA